MKKIIAVFLLVCIMASICSVSACADDRVWPKAIVTELDVNKLPGNFDPPAHFGSTLTYAYSFAVDPNQDLESMTDLADWLGDFSITVEGLDSDDEIYLSADDPNADGYISGHYEGWGGSGYDDTAWINIPSFVTPKTPVKIIEGKSFKVLATVKEVLREAGMDGLADNFDVTCAMIAGFKSFDCGIYLTPAFLARNPNMKITIALNISSPDGSEHYTVASATIAPPPPPPVPATADNSNMPLWGTLFLAFAAVAVLTGKKRRA